MDAEGIAPSSFGFPKYFSGAENSAVELRILWKKVENLIFKQYGLR